MRSRIVVIVLSLLVAVASILDRAAAQAVSAPPQATDVVRYGELGFTADAGVYIAADEGFFAEQGIRLEMSRFDSAAMMVAPLAASQLDVGNGAPSAALYDAISQGLDLKIVADAGQNTANGGVVMIFSLHKDSPITTPAQLKGAKVSLPAKGISPETDLRALLRLGNLNMTDVEIVLMSFADAATALRNGSITMAMQVEPFGTRIRTSDWGKTWMVDNQIHPNHQVAVLLYGPQFVKSKSDVAKRFMTAYVKGARLYNDAFFKKDAAAKERVLKALINHTPVKDPAVWNQMTYRAISPDGQVNMASLQEDQEYFLESKLQKAKVDLSKVVDSQYVEFANKQLGLYSK